MSLPPELQPTPIADEKLLMLRRAVSLLEAADPATMKGFAAILMSDNNGEAHLEISAMCNPCSAAIFAIEFLSKTKDVLQSKGALSVNDTLSLLICNEVLPQLALMASNYLKDHQE